MLQWSKAADVAMVCIIRKHIFVRQIVCGKSNEIVVIIVEMIFVMMVKIMILVQMIVMKM